MARSLIVEVRKALVEGLRDAIDDGSVSVTYGWKGDDDERREQVYTNRPRATHEPASLKSGRTFRNEQMDFDVVFLKVDPAEAPEDTDERLMDLVQVLEEYVADHKHGDPWPSGLNWIIVTAFEMQNQLGPTGSLTVAQVTLRYAARLT